MMACLTLTNDFMIRIQSPLNIFIKYLKYPRFYDFADFPANSTDFSMISLTINTTLMITHSGSFLYLICEFCL